MMGMKIDVTFPVFVALWNKQQGRDTPRVHTRMASWLHHRHVKDDERLLLMAFRGCGKSTLVGLYCAWVLMRDACTRILVVSADDPLAARMVRNIRRIIERHPLCANLIPDGPDQWASDRFTVKRDTELRDPSVVACGILGNMTGMRADLIVCDDVEVPNTCGTAEKREFLRERLADLSYIAFDRARILYIGTPHTFDTIYETRVRDDIPGHVPHLNGYKTLQIPVINNEGEHAWMERFGPERLDQLHTETGARAFESQMMLRPVSIRQCRLDPGHMPVYEHDVVYAREINALYIGEQKIVSCSAWWDPAFGSVKGDGSVLAVVYTDTRGYSYIHAVNYMHIDPNSSEAEAQQQCSQVARTLKDLHVPVVGIETNGIGRLLPGLLRRELVRAQAGAAVVEHTAHGAKNERILRAFETRLAARMVFVHKDVLKTRFLDEMRDFDPEKNNKHDDGIDAVASALLQEPVRVTGTGGGYVRVPWRAQVHTTQHQT